MSKIFISYSHADSDFVDRLYQDLLDLKADIWMDKQIRAGEDWRDKMETALAECDTMLLVISPDSMSSKVVKQEYEHFLKHSGTKTLIPIPYRLAEVPREIQKLNHVDFRTSTTLGPLSHLHFELTRLGHTLEPLPLTFNSHRLPGKQRLLPLEMTDMIRVARYNLSISGIALDSIAHKHLDLLAEKLDENVCIRLMPIALDPDVLNDTADWLGSYQGHNKQPCASLDQHVAWFKQRGLCEQLSPGALELGVRVRDTLATLCAFSQTHPFSNTFQVRLLHKRPTFGYFIVDPDRRDAQLTAAPYLSHMEHIHPEPPGANRPPHLFYLAGESTDDNERIWFERYRRDFEWLWWRSATELDCAALDLR